jgi:hypothetical protein
LDTSEKKIWNVGDHTSVNSVIYTGHLLLSESSNVGGFDRLSIYGMEERNTQRGLMRKPHRETITGKT